MLFDTHKKIESETTQNPMSKWGLQMAADTVGETIATLEFSHDGLYVHPNLGPRDIQSRHDSSRYHRLNAKLGISIYHDQWIKWNGKKVLWLSVESWTETLGPYLAR
ncbi:unnamed protein product [Penicillium camemberti]|uniref:Str. FM013 n=1 Tax=Penicillium camemberti (strain FM 013) TaxID=1429867 RepID=A0A0G4NUI7_PENC3|nr:unnamed protein product [Penicillium camemberti]